MNVEQIVGWIAFAITAIGAAVAAVLSKFDKRKIAGEKQQAESREAHWRGLFHEHEKLAERYRKEHREDRQHLEKLQAELMAAQVNEAKALERGAAVRDENTRLKERLAHLEKQHGS